MATVSLAYVQAILSASNADEEQILTAAGLDSSILRNDRLPLWVTYKLWDASRQFNSGPLLGFQAAEKLETGALGIVEYICRNSKTVGEALRDLCEYINLLNDSLFCALFQDEKTARLIPWMLHTSAGLHPQGAEFLFGFLRVVGQRLTSDKWNPELVCFHHQAEAPLQVYTDFFQAPVLFGSSIDELRFSRKTLDLPLTGSDARLKDFLSDLAVKKAPAQHLRNVSKILEDGLDKGTLAGIREIASQMGMSERTIRRSLESQGSSYRKILDGIRKKKALELLLMHNVSTTELGSLLGFSEQAAFHRAFKRWFGEGPENFRRRLFP